MFIGHFGVAFAAKPLVPRVSLGSLILASLFVDLLWPTFLLLGLERVRIEPGATAVTPLVFEHYPLSHSLLAVLVWAALIGGVYLLFRRDRAGAAVLAALVVSHWLLDLIVHRPDLPLYPSGTQLLGLDAWSSLPLTLAIEVPLFLIGVGIYLRATAPKDAIGSWGLGGLVVFLAILYLGNLFGSPPPDVAAIAWAGQAQWLLVAWGYWVDRHRRRLPRL